MKGGSRAEGWDTLHYGRMLVAGLVGCIIRTETAELHGDHFEFCKVLRTRNAVGCAVRTNQGVAVAGVVPTL